MPFELPPSVLSLLYLHTDEIKYCTVDLRIKGVRKYKTTTPSVHCHSAWALVSIL